MGNNLFQWQTTVNTVKNKTRAPFRKKLREQMLFSSLISAMPYERVYQSGAAKRRKRAKEKQEASKSRKVLEGFLKRKSEEKTDEKEGTNESENQLRHSDEGTSYGEVETQDENERGSVEDMSTQSKKSILSESEEKTDTSTSDEQDNHGSRSEVSEEEVESVIVHHDFGCIQPGGLSEKLTGKIVAKGSLYFQNKDKEFLFPKEVTQDKQRSLTSTWFTSKLPLGETCNRSWLLFSPSLECLFCFPCVLFSEAPQNALSTLGKVGVGFKKWKKPEKLKDHEEGIFHRRAFMKWKLAEGKIKEEEDEISHMFHAQMKKNQQYWREILKRVAASVKFLAKSNLSFRGHRETLEHANPGNFLASLKFLSEFDDVMRFHLERIEFGKTHYLSPAVQNEFINLMGNKVRESIVEKIKQAHYFSLMVDSTPDISHQEQVSLILRYLDSEDLEVKESFLGFFIISKPDAQHYEELILKALDDLGLDFSLCRGQTYDNAATMSGHLSGLQKRLLDINPKATFLNCDNHSLNLAALHAAEVDPTIVTFFGTLQELFNFFAHSPQRWAKLKEIGAGSLKIESGTRWSAREEATKAVSLHLDKIIHLLDELSECPSERVDTRSKARNLLLALENYNFFAFLEFWSNILRPINIVQKKLQHLGLNIKEAAEEIKTLSCFFDDEKEREKLIARSIKYAEQGSSCYGFPTTKRIRRKKRLDSEESSDAGLPMVAEFKRVATEVLDRLLMEMKERFKRLRDHVDRFGFLLQTDVLLSSTSMDEENLEKDCADFALFYDELQPKPLFNDIIDARVLFLCKEAPKTPGDTLKKLAAYGSDVCPNLVTAIRILVTMGTSIASSERSFSKLKLIKTYLRSTMTEDRLSSLALMSIESDILDKVNIDELINDFAAKKARRETI